MELRKRVLAAVPEASVLDAFCGDGVLWSEVWSEASAYTGLDVEMPWPPEFRRFSGDNRRVLRAIDLRAFNVFDLDAWGCPWYQALIIAHRRAWKAGEVGALVVTDGGGMKSRYGVPSRAVTHLLGIRQVPRTAKSHDTLFPMLLRAWANVAGVTPRHCWTYRSKSSGRGGSQAMYYGALVFEGLSDAAARGADSSSPEGGTPAGRV